MKPYARIAVEFATALVDGDFDRAHALLSPTLRRELPPERLREELYSMFSGYADGDPTSTWFDEEMAADPVHDDWPAKQRGDAGWAYVGIHGDDFQEAVTVTIADVDGELLIRDIEWGRP